MVEKWRCGRRAQPHLRRSTRLLVEDCSIRARHLPETEHETEPGPRRSSRVEQAAVGLDSRAGALAMYVSWCFERYFSTNQRPSSAQIGVV